MGEQLELFEDVIPNDDAIQKTSDVYEPFEEPMGFFGIVAKYCKDGLYDANYWFRFHFKYPYQRMKNGWSAYDTWSLDDYLTDVIVGSVTHLRDHTPGYPAHHNSIEEWQKELTNIIKAFEDYKNFEEDSRKRLGIAYKLYSIPTWTDMATGDVEKFNDYLNNPKYNLPSDVYTKFWAEEERIYNNIKKRMKHIIDVWGNLWD